MFRILIVALCCKFALPHGIHDDCGTVYPEGGATFVNDDSEIKLFRKRVRYVHVQRKLYEAMEAPLLFRGLTAGGGF